MSLAGWGSRGSKGQIHFGKYHDTQRKKGKSYKYPGGGNIEQNIKIHEYTPSLVWA
jgi:hypothetical protein